MNIWVSINRARVSRVLYTAMNKCYYVREGSTVIPCTLDISKAFVKDKVFILLRKLMDRKIWKTNV